MAAQAHIKSYSSPVVSSSLKKSTALKLSQIHKNKPSGKRYSQKVSLDSVLNQIPKTRSQILTQKQHAEVDQLLNSIAKNPTQHIPASDVQLNQYHFNFGPNVQLGGEYSSEFGPILNTKWGYQFGDGNAAMLEGDFGPKEYRVGLTWAFMPTANQRMKITLEHLAQKMKFDFIAGDVNRWVSQNAIGGEYDYLFSNNKIFNQVTFNSLGISGYYSKAQSKDLGIRGELFQQDDYWYRWNNRIAGGVAKGFQFHLGLSPWRWSSLKLGLGYDAVDYDRKYQKDKHDSGLAGSINLEQILNQQLKFNLGADLQSAYDDYSAGMSYLIRTHPGSRLELGVKAEHIQGHTGLSNDNRFGLDMSYNWGGNRDAKLAGYKAVSMNRHYQDQLLNWAMTPAVHMAKVLAIKDEGLDWTPQDPKSSPIADIWAKVGTGFYYNVSDSFDPNGDKGVFHYRLSSIIAQNMAHSFGADEPINLKFKAPAHSGEIINADSVVSNDAVDSDVSVLADKYSRGRKIGPTQKQSFKVYVEPTSKNEEDVHAVLGENFLVCMEKNSSVGAPNFEFVSHGGGPLSYSATKTVEEPACDNINKIIKDTYNVCGVGNTGFWVETNDEQGPYPSTCDIKFKGTKSPEGIDSRSKTGILKVHITEN